MPRIHDLCITFSPRFSEQKSFKATPTPPPKAHNKELVWFNHAVEYLTLPANFKLIILKRGKVNFPESTWKLTARDIYIPSLTEGRSRLKSMVMQSSRQWTHNHHLHSSGPATAHAICLLPHGSVLGICCESEYLALDTIRMKDTSP